jgi:hypothetical protein
LNPEDITKRKHQTKRKELGTKRTLNLKTGADLDVPGSELDDQQENVGSEDEENNYYSMAETTIMI